MSTKKDLKPYQKREKEYLEKLAAEKEGFARLALRLFDVLVSQEYFGENFVYGPAREWGGEAVEEVTNIMRETFGLFGEINTTRAEGHQKEIEGLLREFLGHSKVVFGPDDELHFQCSEVELHARMDACSEAVLEKLKELAIEFPHLAAEYKKVHTPEEEKNYIAQRLGRTRRSLDVYVSDRKANTGQDLPWVIRKPGLPWLPDIEAFEEWRKTHEGQKKRGRPRSK
jgi:hypothetical protein